MPTTRDSLPKRDTSYLILDMSPFRIFDKSYFVHLFIIFSLTDRGFTGFYNIECTNNGSRQKGLFRKTLFRAKL